MRKFWIRKEILIISLSIILAIVIVIYLNKSLDKDTSIKPNQVITSYINSESIPVSDGDIETKKWVAQNSDLIIEVDMPYKYRLNVVEGNSGMKYWVSNTNYNGITKIEISNETDQSIVSIAGVSGVGGNTNINKCFKFNDTDQEFINTLTNNEIADNVKFNEIKLFGSKIRITEYNDLALYFQNFSKTGLVFCEPIFFSFSELGFTVKAGEYTSKENLYKVVVDKNFEKRILVKILSSLKVTYK